MGSCTRCGSFAINPSLHGRRDMCKPVGLCDVCYWRSLAEIAESRLAAANERLEAAERDAATERAIQNAADKLPDGYAISLYVENGSGYIDLTDPEGDPVPVDTDDRSMADQITQATKVAIDAATQEGEG